MAPLSELVPRVYPSSEPEELRLVRLIAWWERQAPARLRRNARPARLRNGALVIHAVTGAWAQELTLLLPALLPGLLAAAPHVDPKKVRVQVGPLPRLPAPPRPRPPLVPPLPIGALPEPVARSLAAIADDRLRDAILRAAAQSLAPRPP